MRESPVTELEGRDRMRSKRIVPGIREENLTGIDSLVISLHHIRALHRRAAVHLIAGPPFRSRSNTLIDRRITCRMGGFVNVIDRKSLSAAINIPSVVRATFYKIILIRIRAGKFQKAPIDIDRFQFILAFFQFFRLSDAKHVAVNGIVIRRCAAIVVVIAAVHQRRRLPERLRLSTTAFQISVIHIDKSQDMTVFVAESTNRAELEFARSAARKFRRNRIMVNAFPVQDKVNASRFQMPRMGPDAVVPTAIRLILTGNEDKDVIHNPIAIVIICRKVNAFFVGQTTSLSHSLMRPFITSVLVFPVIFKRIGKRDNRRDVKCKLTRPQKLVREITFGAVFTFVYQCLEVLHRMCHLNIRKFSQKYEAMSVRNRTILSSKYPFIA